MRAQRNAAHEDPASMGLMPAAEEDADDAQPLLSSSAAPTASASAAAANNPFRRAISKATLLHEEESEPGGTLHAWLHEAGRLGALAAPLVTSSMSSFLVSMISIAFVGRLGEFELSAAVMATSFFNITGLALLTGSLGALDTLCAQAYGAANYAAVGVALQRSLVFASVTATIVAAVWIKMEALMLALGQDPGLSAAAADFVHWLTPALFFIGWAECLKRYLTAQSVVAPATVASIISMLVAPLFNWLFIVKLKHGLRGAAVASNLAQAAPLLVMLAWTLRRHAKMKKAGLEKELTWQGWSREALSGWGTFLRLAGPSAAMVCLEWSTFEACVIMAGWLPTPELKVAVMGLTLNVSGFLYMLPMGLSGAIAVRVGNALGAGLPHAARRSAHIGAGVSMCIQITLMVVVLALHDSLALIFTDQEPVKSAAAPVFNVLAVCLLGDGMNACVGGVLRGAGRQEVGALFNLVAFWIVGLPLAALCAFKFKLEVVGLWLGLATCAGFNGIAMTTMLLRMDWKKEMRRALGRLGDPHGDEEDDDGLQAVEFISLTNSRRNTEEDFA